MKLRFSLCVATVVATCAIGAAKDFTLTVLHTNDMHSHVDPTIIKKLPFGGYARQMTLIKKYRKEDPNTVLLNAGDTFQGTIYFTQYNGLADLAFMNMAGYDAMALGNHEFDKGTAVLADFVDRATFPILSSNLDLSADARLNGKVRPYTILKVGGETIGVVGAITEDLPTISNIGTTVKMKPIVESVQASIDALQAKKVNKIILLSHCGYGEERKLAAQLRGLDMVVGGHSHTLLGNAVIENFPAPGGKYPTEVTGADGGRTLVVQAWEWGKVLGRIQVQFDGQGRVLGFKNATPIVIDGTIAEDPTVKSVVDALAQPLLALKRTVLGEAPAGVSREGSGGRETEMGDLITDSMIAATAAQGPQIAMMNAGGIRGGFEAGKITVEHAISVQPFGNTLHVIELTGAEILGALDHGLDGGGFLQVSKGFSYTFDQKLPKGKRIVAATLQGAPLQPETIYKVVLNNFTANGGDGHEVLKNAKGKRIETGLLDVDALMDYIKLRSPIRVTLEGRIINRNVSAFSEAIAKKSD